MQRPLFGYGKNADCGIFLRPLFILLRIAMLRVRIFAEGGFFMQRRMHMLQIKSLSIYHKKDLHALLKDFSFVLKDGEKVALIGEEGNGKSTLLKLIYSPMLIEDYAEYSGEIITGNTIFGYLPQELSEAEKALSVAEFLTKKNFFHLPYGEGAKLCSSFGLSYESCRSEQQMSTLSGGEKVKFLLLAALCKQPDVLLLDEPSNDLDIEALEWLEHFINECDIAILYTSHDETLLENTATAIIHMEQLRKKTVPRAAVLRISYSEYVRRRAELFEHQEQVAQSDRREFDKKMERFRRILSVPMWLTAIALAWVLGQPAKVDAMTLALGYLVRPAVAPLIGTVCYLVMTGLGGLFVPLSAAPGWVSALGRLSPTYRYSEVAADAAFGTAPSWPA